MPFRPLLWPALLGVLLSALWPFLTRPDPIEDPIRLAVCTADGAGAGPRVPQWPSPRDDGHDLSHCVLCLSLAAPALPAAARRVATVCGQAPGMAPCARAADTPVIPGARPRAPPRFA